jgi:hypothetical protein
MMKTLLAAAAILSLAAPAYADITYQVANKTYTNLGAAPDDHVSGDTLFGGGIQTGDYTGPGTYALKNIQFLAGNPFPETPAPFSGLFTGEGVFSSVGDFAFDVAYSMTFGPDGDTITLGGNSFQIEGYNILIDKIVLGTGAGQIGTGVLTATVSAITSGATGGVPEPATWAMMLVGFGGLGAVLRRQRSGRVQAVVA